METSYNKLISLLKSRKFWALLLSAVTIWSGYFMGEIVVWQAVQATVAALAVYSTGVAIEDAGWHIGK